MRIVKPYASNALKLNFKCNYDRCGFNKMAANAKRRKVNGEASKLVLDVIDNLARDTIGLTQIPILSFCSKLCTIMTTPVLTSYYPEY